MAVGFEEMDEECVVKSVHGRKMDMQLNTENPLTFNKPLHLLSFSDSLPFIL